MVWLDVLEYTQQDTQKDWHKLLANISVYINGLEMITSHFPLYALSRSAQFFIPFAMNIYAKSFFSPLKLTVP